jgi:hypothetical protein
MHRGIIKTGNEGQARGYKMAGGPICGVRHKLAGAWVVLPHLALE